MSTALSVLTSNIAKQFNMGDGSELQDTLKQTCFKGGTSVTDAQMTALLIVAQQYSLNPFTRELYAFPDKGGIVPVVGVDGWSRIINSNTQFDGMDFEQDADSCTCTIYRKDRTHPTKLTEWMAECKRPGVKPWESHPYRMLRHKAMIQCARIAFGFGGIYDADEAERIIENSPPQTKTIDPATGEISKPLPAMPKQKFDVQLPRWANSVNEGGKVSDLLSMLQSKYTLSAEQLTAINELAAPAAPATPDLDDEFVRELGE